MTTMRRGERDFPGIEGVNAVVKLLCLGLLIAAIVHCDSLPGFALATAVMTAVVYISSLPLKTLFQSYKRLFGLFFWIELLNTLFYAPQLCFTKWWIFCPSAAGAHRGAVVVCKLVLAAAALEVFAASVKHAELSDAFGLILSPLRFAGLPAAKIAAVAGESVRVIPDMLTFSAQFKANSLTMGIPCAAGEKTGTIRMLSTMTASVFRNAEKRAEYLETRGLGLDRKIKPYYSDRIKQLSPFDLYAFLVCASLWALEVLVL